jgi:hypothetical protein
MALDMETLAKFMADPQGTVDGLVAEYKRVAGNAKGEATKQRKAVVDTFEKNATNNAEAKEKIHEFHELLWSALDLVMFDSELTYLARSEIRAASKAITAEHDYNVDQLLKEFTPNVSGDERDTASKTKDMILGLLGIAKAQESVLTIPENLWTEYKLPSEVGTKRGRQPIHSKIVFEWNGEILPDTVTTNEVAHNYISSVKDGVIVRWSEVVKDLNNSYPNGWMTVETSTTFKTGVLRTLPRKPDEAESDEESESDESVETESDEDE